MEFDKLIYHSAVFYFGQAVAKNAQLGRLSGVVWNGLMGWVVLALPPQILWADPTREDWRWAWPLGFVVCILLPLAAYRYERLKKLKRDKESID